MILNRFGVVIEHTSQLADEPVSMLDVSIRLEILNLLDRLQREEDLAVLYVTHDLATARYFASSTMVLYRGQPVETGPSDEVILRPAHPHTRLLAAAAPDPTTPRTAAPGGMRALRGTQQPATGQTGACSGTAAPRPCRSVSGRRRTHRPLLAAPAGRHR